MTFVATNDHGVPNLVPLAPRLWRMGHPQDDAAWDYLRSVVGQVETTEVLLVCLHDEKEGDDSRPTSYIGWQVLHAPIPPEDDKPWTVLVLPDKTVVADIVNEIAEAYERGWTVIWHCKHGRDRTGLISALVGMRLLGWTKEWAWNDMLTHGFRWELPDLDLFWATEVQG